MRVDHQEMLGNSLCTLLLRWMVEAFWYDEFGMTEKVVINLFFLNCICQIMAKYVFGNVASFTLL